MQHSLSLTHSFTHTGMCIPRSFLPSCSVQKRDRARDGVTTRLWPPQGLGEACSSRGDSMARAECQTGYQPELGFSQSRGHASAPQPWARKTGQLLVSCGVRFSAPSTWDNPASSGDKTILVFKTSVQRPTMEPLSGSERPFSRAGDSRSVSYVKHVYLDPCGLPHGPGACFLPARGCPPRQA